MLLIVTVALVQAAAPVFEVGISPGEGIPRFEAAIDTLTLVAHPSRSADVVARAPNSKGKVIRFDETRYQTLEAGQVVVTRASIIRARVLGTIRFLSREAYYSARFPVETRSLDAGQVIEYLQYRAEGTCFVRVDGVILDADACPERDEARFRWRSRPRVEWWIHVSLATGERGWLLVDDSSVKQLPRGF